MNTKFFIDKSNIIHNNKYNYSLVDYINAKSKVKIICNINKHGIFEQEPHSHLSGHGCPRCRDSKGEIKIKNYLIEKNINFVSQKKFNDCRDAFMLPFDFYLPGLNICIEYDGEQHFKSIKHFGGDNMFIDRQKKYNIKTNYCLENDIELLRIRKNNFNELYKRINSK